MLIFASFTRIALGIIHAFGTFFSLSFLLLWDASLTLANLLLPKKKKGQVYLEGMPGFGGTWPEYRKPGDGDSRCSCPALNAMANHGILPRNGRNIPFKQMTTTIHSTFNFSKTFCLFVPKFAAGFLQRDYETDTLDLNDLDVHNCIEHDASVVRHDVKFHADQSTPAVDLIEELLASASGTSKEYPGEKILTPKDLSKFIEMRRAHSKINNPQYTLTTGQRMFGSSNASTLLVFFGGIVSDLRTFLLEERFPDGWETKQRSRNGITITSFNGTVNKVEFAVNEKKVTRKIPTSSGSDTAKTKDVSPFEEPANGAGTANGAGATNGSQMV